MVSILVNPVSMTWMTDVISVGFFKEDVPLIFSIPLSRSGHWDRLVWHRSENGLYTVKTRYGVALVLMENDVLWWKGRGLPSSKTNLNQVWNKIWSLEVQTK